MTPPDSRPRRSVSAASDATRTGDVGLTLIELLVAMVMFSILVAVGAGGWMSYHRSVEHRGSAQELVSALRKAQQASLTEAVTYCVSFDVSTRSYSTYKFTCDGSGTLIADKTTQSTRVALASPVFTQTDGTTAATVSFFPRGSATRGSVRVTRDGSAKSYTIDVEGLTGRVSLAE